VANFFNLSPFSTDGKYQNTMMLHMVFKVYKTIHPAGSYCDVEKLLTDKKGHG
jgi:hypothetical protein